MDLDKLEALAKAAMDFNHGTVQTIERARNDLDKLLSPQTVLDLIAEIRQLRQMAGEAAAAVLDLMGETP